MTKQNTITAAQALRICADFIASRFKDAEGQWHDIESQEVGEIADEAADRELAKPTD